MTFGSEIESARTLKGLNQRALASLVGISQPFLSELENGRRLPSQETVQKLASALDLSADWLYYLLGQIPPDLANLNYEIVSSTFQRLRLLVTGQLALDVSLTRDQANEAIAYLRKTQTNGCR